MWGCDYGPMTGGWWGGFLSMLIWGLVLFLVVYVVIRIFRSQTQASQRPLRDRSDSEAILKSRFAKGEISREEFVKMRQTLSQP